MAVYRANFSPTHDSADPIEILLPGEPGEDCHPIEENLKQRIGSIDCVLAGPPCQGHSALNYRTRHQDGRNALYLRVGRFAEVLEPRHILIENVPTVTVDRSRSIHQTIEHLESLGYDVDSAAIDLSTIGVPQRRKRHIVVASKDVKPDLQQWVSEAKVETRSVWWAIGDLEKTSANGLLNTPANLSPENRRRIDYLFDNKVFDLDNAKRPKCHQDGNHSYVSMYGRLRHDQPAQTITTGFTSPGQGRFIHPTLRRTLTPREAARLQFIPDDFDFSNIKYRTALARLIGNAVPPKLSWVVFRKLLK